MNNKLFSERHSDSERTIKRMFGAVFVLGLIWVAVYFTIIGTIIYIAHHFISKYW